ncbi:MAG: PAS domain-containing protein [Bacteroidetes bacterium]|nr:PAS domain-containing protein [Bacteroidota bacterium]
MEHHEDLLALRETEQYYKTLINSLDEGFCIIEMIFDENEQPKDYRFLEINPQFEAQTGLNEAIGKTVKEMVPGHEQHWFDIYGKVALTGESIRFVNIAENVLDGTWYDVFAYRIGKPENRKVAVLFRDITVQKLAEAQLKLSEEKSRNILESISDAFFALDADWCFTYLNPQAEKLLDKSLGNLINVSIWEAFPGLHGSKFEKLYLQVAKEKVSGTLTAFYPDHDRWYEVHVYPAHNDGITIYFRDATQRVRAEEELRSKNHELEQFAYVASHDLQEPLNTIKSFIEIIETEEEATPAMQEYLVFMKDSAVRMSALIKDLLDHSRIGNRKNGSFSSVDFSQVLAEVISDLKHLIREKQADIQSGPLPLFRAHPQEINMLFQNLLTNALKFQRLGVPPIIRISATEEEQYWHFKVGDNGIGIATEHSEKIFKMFQRLHSKEEIPGTGVGLAQCRKIVELHRGRIWLESEEGVGSVFNFTIDKFL